ncbi:TetR family transcriptional regulator [Streptomyces sp. SID8361]|uniref:TetR/AcrR family transcriptional regulator n=1 Tax=Streptomyces TaxID=1883 RepID=UPI00081D9D32|nr:MULTISPECIES: TetR/AcrR family transcriptional regulator [unclassified Streptomyces]AUA10538.1 Bacterial regulatory protein, tetR family [Streptomyces sp. M56]MYU09865.1 TetR family transcriptional regulator [Streptomyces sp. SID8361]MYX57455.1 TetR family transcriptional regulator [Streptomyces sp. SID8382]SCF65976.1 transcriptional regulator, TetR family [Streptomyces sp. MnatMP-M27]
MRSDAQANRDRVLAAAEEVFGESGKAGSTEEVARRAGVGIGTVFRHFPTKQLLVEATIVRHLTQLTDTARARGEGGEAGAAFRMTFREMVSGAPAKLALVALMEESADPAGATDEVEAAASALRDAVEVLLSRGQEAGEVRADATVAEVYVLIRALANARGDRAVVARAIDMVLDGLSPRRSE